MYNFFWFYYVLKMSKNNRLKLGFQSGASACCGGVIRASGLSCDNNVAPKPRVLEEHCPGNFSRFEIRLANLDFIDC